MCYLNKSNSMHWKVKPQKTLKTYNMPFLLSFFPPSWNMNHMTSFSFSLKKTCPIPQQRHSDPVTSKDQESRAQGEMIKHVFTLCLLFWPLHFNLLLQFPWRLPNQPINSRVIERYDTSFYLQYVWYPFYVYGYLVNNIHCWVADYLFILSNLYTNQWTEWRWASN